MEEFEAAKTPDFDIKEIEIRDGLYIYKCQIHSFDKDITFK